LETLIARDSWATLEDMENVVLFHIAKYKEVVEKCKKQSPLPSKQDLSFCTRFVTTYLFLRLKCSRPMTFQFLTLPMIDKAKVNGGFVDQTEFKTARRYSFDTLIISAEVFTILDTYIDYIRPLFNPTCNYLLLSMKGNQYQSLTTAMTMLVYEAIGKYIHPTRYRQIVEITSAEGLSRNEQEVISEDQKHSSTVAKVYYKKKQSRTVALEGKKCMEKMIGSSRQNQNNNISNIFSELQTLRSEELHKNQETTRQSSASSYQAPTSSGYALMSVNSRPAREDILEKVQDILSASQQTETFDITDEDDDNEIELTIASYSPPVTTFQKKSFDAAKISNNLEIKKEEALSELRKPLKNTKFSSKEDEYLLKGMKKYGNKNWSSILKDSEFNFHACRTRVLFQIFNKDLVTYNHMISHIVTSCYVFVEGNY